LYVEKARQVMSDHRKSFSRAVEAGVKIAMGTDSGVGPHGENAEELELMVKGGMSPMDAIVASTSSGARLLKIQEHVGTLETGKIADLILVDGNPLEDISILKDRARIALVMQGGRIVKNLQPNRVSSAVA
jgi:imidazolonepropionase-like amidohydrolase